MVLPHLKTDVIDADAHVIETERTWEYLERSEEKYRPALVAAPGNPARQIWVLDGENLGPKFPAPDQRQSEEHFKRFGRAVATPAGTVEHDRGAAQQIDRNW